MKLFNYDEESIIKDFEKQCPVLWNTIVAIMTPSEASKLSTMETGKRISKGKKDAYYILNHILKLLGSKTLTVRAAIVGIFLESQGNSCLFMNLFIY